jgi:tRNA uridine 5-carbamoylmethylation protein Kti12
MTTVVNLFAGPGSGKSTTAALLFGELKLRGINTELVREYVKTWAWNDRKVGEMDQLYLLGKQSSYENMLYNKVDVIVTDSPVLIAGVYEEFYSNGQKTYASNAALSFLDHSQEIGIIHKNYFLKRKKAYDAEVDDRERIDFIIKDLGLDKQTQR